MRIPEPRKNIRVRHHTLGWTADLFTDELHMQIPNWDNRYAMASEQYFSFKLELWCTLRYNDADVPMGKPVIGSFDEIDEIAETPVWTCYHCGFTATSEHAAAIHFGNKGEHFQPPLCLTYADLREDERFAQIEELTKRVAELRKEKAELGDALGQMQIFIRQHGWSLHPTSLEMLWGTVRAFLRHGWRALTKRGRRTRQQEARLRMHHNYHRMVGAFHTVQGQERTPQ